MAKENDGRHVPRRLTNFEVMRRQVFLGCPEPEPVYYKNRHLYKLNRADIKDQEKVARFLEDEDAVAWDFSRGEFPLCNPQPCCSIRAFRFC